MLLALVTFAAAQDPAPVRPPAGVHVGLGAGVGSSFGGVTFAGTGTEQLANVSYNSSLFWVAGSMRIRMDNGFTWEPEVECATGAGVARNAESEPTQRARQGECRVGVSLRPRIAARGSLELHGIVGAAYAGEWSADLENESAEVRARALEHGLHLDAGFAIQKWLAPDVALSVDLHGLMGTVGFAGEENDTGELDWSTTAWNVGLDPGTRLMLHLYW